MTTIWHNPRCSKSRQTLALLQERGINPTIVKYLETPPSTTELAQVLSLLGKTPLQLTRTKEALFAELALADAELTEQQWLQTLVANPKLIERPVVIHGNAAAVGRPPEAVLELL